MMVNVNRIANPCDACNHGYYMLGGGYRWGKLKITRRSCSDNCAEHREYVTKLIEQFKARTKAGVGETR